MSWWQRNWLYILVAILIVVSHGYNMFGFPYFENDEGVYTAQGWWLVEYGELAPYTYWYDHAPFGWVVIGLWQKLTGGPFALGFSLYSTRVFMLVVSVVSGWLLAYITAKVSGNRWLALLAVVVWGISPMAIYFQRRVLLDNLMVVWLLGSMAVLIGSGSKITRIALSGLLFGLAFLSKEVVVFALPAMLVGVYLYTKKENRSFAMPVWLVTACFWIGMFPLLAIVKREFFPEGWLFSQEGPHVSFIDALKFQAGRGGGKGFWDGENMFWSNVRSWWQADPVLMGLGGWGLVGGVIYARIRPVLGWVTLVGLSLVMFLARGGVVFNFYITPLLPFLALCWVLVLDSAFRYRGGVNARIVLGLIVLITAGYLIGDPRPYTLNETAKQLESMEYARKNLPRNAMVAIDNFGFIDWRLGGGNREFVFDNAEWFFKIERDPEIRLGKLSDKWENIDYFVLSHEMLNQMQFGELPFLKEAYERAVIVKDFEPNITTYRDLNEYRSTNGDWATVMKVSGVDELKDTGSGFGGVFWQDQVQMKLREMDVSTKIGQLIWSSVSGIEYKDQKLFGGVVIYGDNVVDQEQIARFVAELKYHNSVEDQFRQPLILVDQEGGDVNRIWFIQSAGKSQADIESVQEALVLGEDRARSLAKVGFDVNLAPVLDVGVDGGAFISRGGRSFGADKENVWEKGEAMIEGMNSGGILPVVKHFPGGLGRVKVDPHIDLPSLEIGVKTVFDGSMESLPVELKDDLEPFARSIENGVGAMMVTHILYPGIDPDWPVSLSQVWIDKILREELGFDGVVVIDDVMMGALDKFSVKEKAKQFWKTSADVLIVAADEKVVLEFVTELVAACEELVDCEERVMDKLLRVWKWRKKME